MLLSLPTWIIHISSMIEWGVAAALLFQYGKKLHRRELRIFGLCLLPHWAGGWSVIAFHLTNDTSLFWIDASKVLNLFGSTALLYGSLKLLLSTPHLQSIKTTVAALMLFIPTYPELLLRANVINFLFQLSTVVHLGFLVSLIFIYRRDKTLFSKLTIIGFWFILVFISVSVACIYFSKVRGYPTLTHDDLLHGFAESFLTMSNLMIVIGIRQKLTAFPKAHLSQQ
jgi:hypothetical protein